MRSVRVLAMVAIAGLLAAGVLIDLPDRPAADRPVRYLSTLAAPAGAVSTWFCPGGSGPDGEAELTIALASGSDQRRAAAVSVLPGGSDPSEARTVDVEIEPRGRVLVKPSEEVPGARWVGAVVEVDGTDVVVEQILAAKQGDVGRSACLTRTASSWLVPHGATRSAVEGERFIIMLLNPFPDIAVADIELVADVGRDTIDGLVVPAQRVVAVDITDEITVATSVAAFVEVVSGRVAASWIQLADGLIAGRGARASTAVAGAAPLWHLPVAGVGPARRDVVAIANPSAEAAEVDLEILAEAPGTDVSPIEITVRPGRTALVDLSQQGRLEGIGPFSVRVRSLDDAMVAASIHSVTFAADNGSEAAAAVAGSTATIGSDAAARRWLVAAEAADSEPAATDGGESSILVVVNPSSVGIAQVALSVDGAMVRRLEVGPRRRASVALDRLGSGRFVVEVESSAPVIAATELIGLTSRTASLGAAVSEPVPAIDIR
ncbi:MAG: hypothetical protein F4Y13_10335 [Acidimicrobiaceae bacterium]|nr:hypothetical protein [Acidimicrobiaceae bacterium]